MRCGRKQSSIRRSWARSVRPSNAEDLANKSEIMGNDKIFEYFKESLASTENSHQFCNWHGRGQYWQRTMLIENVCGTHKHLQGPAVLLSVIHHIGARGARLPLSGVQWTGNPIHIGNHAHLYRSFRLLMLNAYSIVSLVLLTNFLQKEWTLSHSPIKRREEVRLSKSKLNTSPVWRLMGNKR